MKNVLEYINSSLNDIPESKELYSFKNSIVNIVTDRANEITHTGITDEKVIEDIIISEHPDIKSEFETLLKDKALKQKKRKRSLIRLVSIIIYLIALISVYLLVSFKSGDWEHTWVLPACGVMVLISEIAFRWVIVFSDKRGMFLPASRLLLVSCVFIYVTAAFLVFRICFHYSLSWLCFIAGVVLAAGADLIFAKLSKQKFTVFFALLYVPLIASMVYVILGAMMIIHWHPGWLIIPASLIIDGIIVIIRLSAGKSDLTESEVDGEWNES